MRKLILVMVMALLFAVGAVADQTVKTLTFGWEQTNLTNVTQWEMHWSVTAGGPYAEMAVISYDGSGAASYESPVTATVTGEPATTETRYFVLRACGNVAQQDGTTLYLCSDFSNEVSYDFWIPFGQFEVPVNFQVVPTTP